MIRIPNLGDAAYKEIEEYLKETLGPQVVVNFDSGGHPIQRVWRMVQWADGIYVNADEQTECFLALKYGVSND